MAKPKLLNPKKRRVLRKRIGTAELIGSILVLFALSATVSWIAAQRSNYDPKLQDLSINERMSEGKRILLYSRPLKRWQEPGNSSPTKSTDLAIFPQTVLAEDWTVKSGVRTFSSETLFEKINGEAERFLRHGFERLYYLVIQAPDKLEEISIELYDQGGIGGSSGVFSEHHTAERKLEQTGSNVYFGTEIGVVGRKGRYFYRIAGNRSSESIRRKSLQLTRSFSSLPEPTEKRAFGFLLLRERLKIPLAEIRHKRVNVFQFDFAKDFWFGRPEKSRKIELFVHRAQSGPAAGDLFRQIVAEQQQEYRIVEQAENSVVLRHNFLQTFFSMAYRGNYLFGADRAADRSLSLAYLDKIGRLLPHEKRKHSE